LFAGVTSQLHHIHEGEERKTEDDYSDREMDNLDWDALGHPPNRDTMTECESTGPLPTSLTCEQRQAYLLLCPANSGCKKSMPRLAEKSRVVKDYGLRNGNAELISNTCIAVGEIVAVFGETATIWAQDDVREFERIATQQNAIESEVQKQDYPDLEMDDWDWDEMETSPFKETTTAIKRPAKLPPPTENNREVEGDNRQDDYSDHEVDSLNWEVVEHPPDTDTKTKLENTSRLPSSLTCEQRQAHWLL